MRGVAHLWKLLKVLIYKGMDKEKYVGGLGLGIIGSSLNAEAQKSLNAEVQPSLTERVYLLENQISELRSYINDVSSSVQQAHSKIG